MRFQAYIDNIRAKTGKTPDDFHTLAKKKGLIGAGIKATPFVACLRQDFGLGHGHAMAIWAVFRSNGWAGGPSDAALGKKTKVRAK